MNHPACIIAKDLSETRHLAETIGKHIKSGMVLALIGDLGSGKTAFVQGLARGLQVPEDYYVTSPTFTLINEYPGRLRLFHVDLYRIEDAFEFEDTELAELIRPDAVLAIEWAERLSSNFLKDYLEVRFETLSETARKILLTGYGLNAQNLLKNFDIFQIN
ncbi:MAG: tRNA (adenosine(37)-N6)-threonylcarbamoyltransferase complex ATPase subunit type 1 TsaE [Desulfobacterales bacterium]|jgi:tRNA threonylcarbamoyladenosine biosynthesis protein TsaE|nr:tRNA (adenosine(37)-N6)-threonylcarbamoyltransferase complex ATPase subunit type 1 TsaE [Desulfobacterales bacterium]MDD3081634.1 tRNA (adenosine(37)-N6)-threonylcarbamoyltransferase complex ATPase subunit type 1 TsaE [Desulfobacterales bacterium]MDD3950672.1 tRNA (adenosine(37)-N6)-threonylcarbamoyltransferase complex ATPase subunit type 1 TsaE [Desulfobacterales bacterium]MDD4463853.1 tRNA (adenosine(37)-N6)-threonylcarbamoyltransferase complex ATPase subunit type 1 TsaE [Desulfobacterales 